MKIEDSDAKCNGRGVADDGFRVSSGFPEEFPNDLAIRVRDVSKTYRIGAINRRTFRDELIYRWEKLLGRDPKKTLGKLDSAEMADEGLFNALDHVSFDVRKGETIGLIGRNGAGKSTMLKILARITTPTSGEAWIRGRIGSMLEVGTGFHPELTGRENIYLNGAILGMSKKEIDDKFDEIVEFAEIGNFLDTPVKRYSSGMYVKLAFSIASSLDTDVLLLDEVLAVGDAAFRKKSLARMKEIAASGRTIIFVSHSKEDVKTICSRCIWFQDGRVYQDGAASGIVEAYMASVLPPKPATPPEAVVPIIAKDDRTSEAVVPIIAKDDRTSGPASSARPKATVVVPVFNTADYLDECLDSLVAQTLRDIEIVCVDDGSTDASPAKLAAWAEKDSRIRVLRQENRGGGAARNAGLDAAYGDYLFFCDSDDVCEPEMLEDLWRRGELSEADIIVAPRRIWNEGLTKILSETRFPLSIRNLPEPFRAEALMADAFVFSGNVAWNKLFRRSYVHRNGIRFQESCSSDDLAFVHLAMACAERIVLSDRACYRYRSGRAGSLVQGAESAPSHLHLAFGALRAGLEDRGLFQQFLPAYVKAFFVSCSHQICRFRSSEAAARSHSMLRGALIDLHSRFDWEREGFLDERQKECFRTLMDSEEPVPFLLANWRQSVARANDLSLRANEFRSKWEEESRKRKETIVSFRAEREKMRAAFLVEREELMSALRDERKERLSAERKSRVLEQKLLREKTKLVRIEKSLSWRIMAPLRAAAGLFAGRPGKGEE